MTLSASNTYNGTTAINGGRIVLGTTGAISTGPLTLSNGELSLTGTSSGARTLAAGVFSLNTGRDTLTLTAAGTQPISMTFDSLGTRLNTAGGAPTSLYRGTNLGSTPGNGVATILFTTPPTAASGAGGGSAFTTETSGTVGTTQAPVLKGALADTSATGNGIGFATYDSVKGVRLLNPATEQLTVTDVAGYTNATAGDNVLISNTNLSITGKATNTLQINNTTSSLLTLTSAGTALSPVNGLLFSGTSTITLAGTLTGLGNSSDLVLLSVNTAGVTLSTVNDGSAGLRMVSFGGPGNFTVNATISAGGNGPISINGPGTVTLAANQSPSSNGFTVNGGTLKLGTGFAMSSSRPFIVASGGTLDMNGVSVVNVDNLRDINSGGGTITNTSTSIATLTISNGSSTTGNGSFSGNITGSINLVVQSAGAATETLGGTNSYTGTTTINAGTVKLGVANALPTGTSLTINGTSAVGAFLDMAGLSQTVGSLAGTVTTGSATITTSAGGTATLTVSGSTATSFGGAILDGTASNRIIALAKSGSGTLALSGSNSYSGGTTISAGTLKANGLSSTGTGAVIVNGGATLAGSGTAAGAVTVATNGHLAPGNNGVGTLTLGAVTLSGSSILDFEFNGASNDRLVVTGSDATTVNGVGFNLLQESSTAPFSTPGVYDLISFIGSVLTTGTTPYSVLNPRDFRTYNFTTTANTVRLTIGSTVVTGTWSGGNGTGWGTPTNWVNSVVPNSAGASAIFPAVAQTAITLDGDKMAGDLTFNSAAGYTIASGTGGNLVLNNGSNVATITDTLGNHAINAPLVLGSSDTAVAVSRAVDTFTITGNVSGGSSILKSGSGTLALTGSNSFTGGVSLNGGVITIVSSNNLGAVASGVTVNSGTLQALNDITTPRDFKLGSVSSAIQVDGTSTYQINGNVSDGSSAGSLNKVGLGKLILNGSNSYTGATSILGTLQIGASGTAGSVLGGTVSNDGALVVNTTGVVTFGGAVSGTGSFSQTGGKTIFAVSNTFSGPASVTSGTISMGANTALGSSAFTLNNATLTQNNVTTTSSNAIVVQGANFLDTSNANNMTLGGILSGSGSLTRNAGTGTLILSSTDNSGFAGTFASSTGNLTMTNKAAGSANAQWVLTGGTATIPGGGSTNFGSLSGDDGFSGSTSNARMVVGGLGLNTIYSGVIGTGVGGNLGLLKTGTGTLTLTAQNLYAGQALTAITGVPTVIAGGAIIAGASTTGSASGPLGPSTNLVLLGNNGSLGSASLLTGGAFGVGNSIVVSSGTSGLSGYVLSLGGNTDNNSSFSGSITLQNDLTVTQVATTGGHALTISSDIGGTPAFTGPGATVSSGSSAINTGFQTLTFAGPGAINVTGTIANGGATAVNVKTTGGTTTLSGVMTYTGTTSVNGGTLVMSAALSGSTVGLTSVNDGGVLAGTGTTGAVSVLAFTTGSNGGAVDPGNGGASIAANGIVTGNNATGRLTTNGDFTLAAGAHVSLQLSGTSSGAFDQINVLGQISLAGDLQGSLLSGFQPNLNDKFFIMLNDASDPVTGAFSNVAQGGEVSFGSRLFKINYADNGDGGATGNDVSLTAVPEPRTLFMGLSGLGVFLIRRRYRRGSRTGRND
jgi:autotransporter-associated beta strand protein